MVQVVLGTVQVFLDGSQTKPTAQGWLAQFGSWQSTRPLQSLSMPSPQLVSFASGVAPFPEQVVHVDVPVAPATEQVFPFESQTCPSAFPTGWHWGSAQSMRPLQLLSMPSLQISVVPLGQAVHVYGVVAVQVCPRLSQTTPEQDADEHVAQSGPGPPPEVKLASAWPARPEASTARIATEPTQLPSFDSLQETRVTLAGAAETWMAFCPFVKAPRFVETQMAPFAAPLTRTETVFVPFATTEAGLTETTSPPDVGPLGGGLELDVHAASTANEATARRRVRRSM